jgi:hypothetical protein
MGGEFSGKGQQVHVHAAAQIKNPNIEIRNSKQIQMIQKLQIQNEPDRIRGFGFFDFDLFRSGLFRISCFEFRICANR